MVKYLLGPLLANLTQIDAVVNFRAADIAVGGQGAPLTPFFHSIHFSSPEHLRLVLNLGGIANLTALDTKGNILAAFDTGPANTLIDYVCRTYLHQPYDADGKQARQGKVDTKALAQLLSHPYFKAPYPKSTGRELFNIDYIAPLLQELTPLPASTSATSSGTSSASSGTSTTSDTSPSAMVSAINDVLATLTMFTASTVISAIAQVLDQHPSKVTPVSELILCGGGAYNGFLRECLAKLALKEGLNLKIITNDDLSAAAASQDTQAAEHVVPDQQHQGKNSVKHTSLEPKFLEAQAFADLAYRTVHAQCLDLHAVTNAQSPTILGCICPAPQGHYTRLIRQLSQAANK